MDQNEILTTLGYPLIRSDEGWRIDLSELKVFKGLSVLGGIVGEIIEDRVRKNPGDLAFLYKINSNINPELIDLGIYHIQIYGRSDVLGEIIAGNDTFIDDLITVFGTLQRPSWRLTLHPGDGAEANQTKSTSLIFPFTYRFKSQLKKYDILLERAANIESVDQYFLRLSYVGQDQTGLNTSQEPPVVVNDLKNRVYIAGSTRMAGSVRDSVLNARNRGVKEYVEENRSYSHLFGQLEKTRLGRLEKLSISWDSVFGEYISDARLEETQLIFKKMFLAFEAGSICNTLLGGKTVTVTINGCFLTLYLSQLNRVLNVRINQPRSYYEGDRYLKKMPLLETLAREGGSATDFSDMGIFLIHHITSEIIAFIEALRILKAEEVRTLFVKYGGVIPTDYLDTLLEFPPEFLFSAGLLRKTTDTNRNYYTLSTYLSDMSEYAVLEEALKRDKLDFFPAMRLVAGHMFLRFCLSQSRKRKKILLIEDGGYLGPTLTELALSGIKTAEALSSFHVKGDAPEGLFKDWLATVLVGSVEHTKNGFDRLASVEKKLGGFAFPTFSIAISNNKLGEESQEVAHSLLSAIEAILHGNGLVLSQRKTILLGANGNIGRFLTRYLENGRLHENTLPLLRVDKARSNNSDCYGSLSVIPDAELLALDLFIGVTGVSLVGAEVMEKLIIEGTKSRLFFASGSTKTVEFSDLSTWISRLFEADNPKIREIPIEMKYDRIVDPQSGIDQGGKVVIRPHRSGDFEEKTLYLLNDLTPVNFLYYGVPTETMDIVLKQLMTASLGLTSISNDRGVQPGLYAVDHEIDENGNPLR